MEQRRGTFVVFEGIDGSGKGTQMINMAGHIKDLDKYKDLIMTHEPWKSFEIKRKLAEDKEAYSDGIRMAQLYIEDRANHSEEINSRLNEGYFVLCDRYKMSTCAYQWTQGVDLFKLFKMHDNRKIIKPDLNIFIDVPAEIAQQRRAARGKDKEKFEDWDLQKSLASHYCSLVDRIDAKNIFGRVISVNGRGNADEVFERVRTIFDPIYENWKNEEQKP